MLCCAPDREVPGCTGRFLIGHCSWHVLKYRPRPRVGATIRVYNRVRAMCSRGGSAWARFASQRTSTHRDHTGELGTGTCVYIATLTDEFDLWQIGRYHHQKSQGGEQAEGLARHCEAATCVIHSSSRYLLSSIETMSSVSATYIFSSTALRSVQGTWWRTRLPLYLDVGRACRHPHRPPASQNARYLKIILPNIWVKWACEGKFGHTFVHGGNEMKCA